MPGGSQHCGKKCDLCENLVHSDSFKSFADNRVFRIRNPLTCATKYLVYLMCCTNCKQQGVGSTNNMKERWANYKSHNKKSLNTCSITKHFNEICPCPSKPTTYMSVQLIDFVDNCAHLSSEQINDILLNKEKFWVGMLVTMHKGMNSSHDWSRKNRIGGEDFSSA